MRSKQKLRSRLEDCKRKMNSANVEEFYEGRVNTLEKILDNYEKDYVTRLLKKSNNTIDFYDQMALMFGRFMGIGEDMTRKSAYNDGVIIECAYALDADLDLQSENQTAKIDGETVSI